MPSFSRATRTMGCILACCAISMFRKPIRDPLCRRKAVTLARQAHEIQWSDMLWLKAFHIVFVVTWFAGLFYLPRLFVYHAVTTDAPGLARFVVMERRLYF